MQLHNLRDQKRMPRISRDNRYELLIRRNTDL
jgi:hypothetical protein